MRAEAKASLRLSIYMRETDLSCFRGNQLAQSTAHKVQTQGAVKDYCGDDSKASISSASIPASAFTQDSESFDKAKKDKKKKYWQGKRDFKKPKDFTNLASGINAANVGGKEKKRKKKDVSEITWFNCHKKGHYLNNCPKPPKN